MFSLIIMINFNNHKRGFSLIEAVIAIAVMGILLVSILSLQNNAFRSDITYNAQLERILLLKNVLYSPEMCREEHDKEFEKKQNIDAPKTEIKIDSFDLKDLPNKLLKKLMYVKKIIIEATWEGLFGKENEQLLFFKFNKPIKKEKS